MSSALEGLEPSSVWKRFGEIIEIPRPSGHEEKIADYLVSFASQRGLQYRRDRVNNVLILKDGTGEESEAIALQAHTDIVAEKVSDSSHDFLTDPVRAEVEGDRVLARETTLGADNGIGVALMLAVLDADDLTHPPLQCLFTVDEERGLIGAARFPEEWISARRLLNLDTETEGAFCIGCAGGIDVTLRSAVQRIPEGVSGPCYRLSVDGLRGGHSGMEIGHYNPRHRKE